MTMIELRGLTALDEDLHFGEDLVNVDVVFVLLRVWCGRRLNVKVLHELRASEKHAEQQQ